MVIVYLLIIVVLGSVVWSLTRLATTLPNYSGEFTRSTTACWPGWPASG